MHEMGITQEILNAALEAGEKAGATGVNTVYITVGELTEVVADSLQFAWEVLTPGTFFDGSVLDITETPGRSVCMECGTEFEHDRFDRRCTAAGCGSFATQVIAGNELRMDTIDFEAPDEPTAATGASQE